MATEKSLSLDDLENEEVTTEEGKEPQTPITTLETNTDITTPPSTEVKEDEEEEKEEENVDDTPEPDKDKENEGKDKEKDDEEEENDVEAEQFFEEVSAEIGYPIADLEIDFEGEDPLGVKGVAKILKAVGENEVNRFDEYLKNNYPGAYQHFMASMAGISDDEYLKNEENRIPIVPTESEISESIDRQRDLVREDLRARGITKETILKSTLAQLEEEDELQEEALRIREEMEKDRNDRLKELDDKAKAKIQHEASLNNEVSVALESILKTGVVSKGLTLPKEERKKAIEDFKSNLRIENGELYVVQKVDPKEIATALGKNYIGNKGSVDSIIEKKAKTNNVIRLRKQMDDDKNNTKGKSVPGKKQAGGGFTPLADIE